MEKKNKMHMLKITGLVVFNIICLFSIIYVVTTATDKSQVVGQEPDVNVISDFERTTPLDNAGQIEKQQPASTAQDESAVIAEDEEVYPEGVYEYEAQFEPASIKTTQDQLQTRVLVDDFEGDEVKNLLGSRANVYVRAPSRVMIAKRDVTRDGIDTSALMIRYDKRNTGGPNGMGGWCGYYTLIKNQSTGKYFEGSGYNYITFWVRGEKGAENFKIGLADEHWDKVGDSLKSEAIGAYLPEGAVTTLWQEARVPLDVFFLDHANLASITVNFESECFPEGAGSGIIYIDDLALEK